MKYKGAEIFQSKAETIVQVLSEPQVDLWKLRELALSDGGLVNDEIRCMAWPKLVGLHDRLFSKQGIDDDDDHETNSSSPTSAEHKTAFLATASPRTAVVSQLPQQSPSLLQDDQSQASSTLSTRDRILAVSDDFEQIERDVARCTWHLLNGNQRQVAMQMEHKRHNKRVRRLIQRKQRRLANLINLTLQQSYPFVVPKVRYYQGYHDVACVLLATLGGNTASRRVSSTHNTSTSLDQMACTMGLELPASVLLQITQSHLADFTKASFASLQTALKLTVFPLLWVLDKPLHDHLQQAELEPFFLLSWVLTWFSHEIRDTELVKRLFDAFLVGHALLPLYTAVAMMLHPHNRQEVLACECDFSLLHQTLQALPRNSSMVGWKYRPGDGYVSDHEEEEESDDDDDDDMVALENQLLHSDDLAFLKKQRSTQNETPEVMSMESSLVGSSLVGAPKVPFQELLDHALLLMQRIPPSQLVPLATQYYGAAQVEQYLAAGSHQIHLLEPTPVEWAVSPSTPADWVLQQRARGEGYKSTRRERKKEQKLKRKYPNASSTSSVEDITDAPVDEESIRQYLKQHTHTRPVIALGYGRPKKPRFTKKQQKQMLAVAAAVAVAVIAIVWGGGETTVQHVVVPRDDRSRDDSFSHRQTTSKERIVDDDDDKSWDLDDLPELTDVGVVIESDDTPQQQTSVKETLVHVAVVEEEKQQQQPTATPLPRAAFVPFSQTVVGQAAQHWQAQVGHQFDQLRDQTGPRLQNVVKQSQRLAAHVQHEWSDLPETRWKELAVALHHGLQQKAVVLRETARPSVIAQRVQHVRHSLLWLMQNMMFESAKLLKQLQRLQLTDMPLQSIRMVRNMCDAKKPASQIPFFCNIDDDER